MKKYNMAIITFFVVMSSQIIPSYAIAAHELENQSATPEVTSDGHMSWHEFRHELGVYPSVNAAIDHHGVVTLSGHVENSTDKNAVESLANKIRGATDIRSLVNTD